MRLYKKIIYVCMAFAVLLPVIGLMFPQIIGLSGTLIPMGGVTIDVSDGLYDLSTTADSWAEFLVQPLFGDPSEGVQNAILGVLYTLQEAGLPLSVPVLWSAGLALVAVLVELLDLLVSVLMWIPRKVRAIMEV